MTTAEMNRRLSPMPEATRLKVRRLLLEGYGTAGVKFETGASVKEINAVAEWNSRYGIVLPTDAAVQP